LATEGAGSALAVWLDGRAGDTPDLYAQHVARGGELLLGPGVTRGGNGGGGNGNDPAWRMESPAPGGATSSLLVTSPAISGDVEVALVLPADRDVRVDLFDLFGRLVASRVASGTGRRVLALARAADLAPGVYLVRAGFDSPVTRRTVVVH
jgi:hypothetical protein